MESVYLGVVGPEDENGFCRDSQERIVRRLHDSPLQFVRATKGYEARQLHLNNWIDNTHHDYIFFMDHDMLYPADALERLRSHNKPYLSGYYLRRSWKPMLSVWYKPFVRWPFEPFSETVERGKLHELGASGWGCILMHRDVVTATRRIMKNEWEILEDDMDLWPYDLKRILEGIHLLEQVVKGQIKNRKTADLMLEKSLEHLKSEIRPLRGISSPVGSDIRFPFYAKQAGYTLWGDPDVRCGHIINYPLTPDDFDNGSQPDLQRAVRTGVEDERIRVALGQDQLRAAS